ncbi:MAG: FtsQ-type POTRA domain-containing protein [Acidobacteria bacterium]|nr:FtsQ-type POTRA domain-containing protein [Acidobacteriota bacterium]
MARNSSPTISQEELYTSVDEAVRPDLGDTRLVNLDVEDESPFLRGQKRVSVRRSPLPKRTAHRLLWGLAAVALAVAGTLAGTAVYRYSEHSWRFRIDASSDIEISGTHNVSHAQVLEIFGSDIGRNIFFIPLAQRKAQLEQVPWVESASVMRFVPHRIEVQIRERTPLAFARVGSHISLIDRAGVVMELPLAGRRKFSFPVIVGISGAEPISTRAARMRMYSELVGQLDSGPRRYSAELSEVDLSDPDDVKVVANDAEGAVLVHLGAGNFLERYKIYVSHLQEWRQQFDPVESVDLRYDRQIIVNPDLRAIKPMPLSPTARKIAIAAGIKPAVLLTPPAGAGKRAIAPVRVPKSTTGKKSVRFVKKHWMKGRRHAPASTQPARTPAAAGVPSEQPTQASDGHRSPGRDPGTRRTKPSPGIGRERAIE